MVSVELSQGLICVIVVLLTVCFSSCCVGVEPGDRSNAFHRLFLPSVTDGLLTLAAQLMKRTEVSLVSSTKDSYDCDNSSVTPGLSRF